MLLLFFCTVYFLLFIGPIHLISWTIRFFTRAGKSKKYVDSLITYIKYVGIYLLVFIAMYPIVLSQDLNWLNCLATYYIFLAIGLPIYYWKNIFWPSYRRKHPNQEQK